MPHNSTGTILCDSGIILSPFPAAFKPLVPAISTPRTLLPAGWVAVAALADELLPDEQSRAARGLRERKRKVKAHSAMRERSNMPPALPPAADLSNMPTFGWHTEERPLICVLKKLR